MSKYFYTRDRKKKGDIEYCPKCKKKGKITHYVKIDQYVHSFEYSDSKFFRHIKSEVKCDVPTPDKEMYHNNISAALSSVIPNIHKFNDNISAQIVRGYSKNVPEDEMVLDILEPYKQRLQKQVNGKLELITKINNIMNRITEEHSVS
jgi:hypothetical protein